MQRLQQVIFLSLIAAAFGIFLLWPIIRVVGVGFFGLPGDGSSGDFTFGYVAAIFQDEALRDGLFNSAKIALGTTLLCMIISIPLAMLSVRFAFPGKSIMSGLVLVPLILPPFVGAIGMQQILGRFGALTAVMQQIGLVAPGTPVEWFGGARIWGVILVESLSLYPILYLNVSASLANVDPAMEQAAANLGAGRWRIFSQITLPMMRPGLFAGGTIVLIWSFTELGTPLMLEFYRVTPVQIFQRLTQVSGNPTPYALTVVMLVTSVGLYILGKVVLGRGQAAAVTKASVQSAPRKLTFGLGLLALLPFVVVTALALLPHIGVIFVSIAGRWYQTPIPSVFTTKHFETALTHDITVPSIQNSVLFASCSTVIDIAVGLMIAWLIVRAPLPKWLRGTVDSIAMLPLAVPGLVLAFGYLAISLQLQTWIGPEHKDLRRLVDVSENPTLLLVVAYAMRRLPYVVRSAVAGLQQTPADLELAARNIGASSWLTLRRVTVPLIAANLLAGGLLAFAFAMLEVSDSLILAQKQNYWPITKAIYELFFRLGDGPYIASALGVWAMVLLTLTILTANSLLGKRMGAIFRV